MQNFCQSPEVFIKKLMLLKFSDLIERWVEPGHKNSYRWLLIELLEPFVPFIGTNGFNKWT